MQSEIEAKFINIDKDKIRELLRSNNAVLVHEEILMKRENFDFEDFSLQNKQGWVRLRDEGEKITLCYKQQDERSIDGMKEICVYVDNFDTTSLFLKTIGMKTKSYQESKREKWILDNVEVTIDTWPWIPSFVEIEGASEDELKIVANKIGLDWANALHGSVEIAYRDVYDVTDSDINKIKEITFSPVPAFLEEKRK